MNPSYEYRALLACDIAGSAGRGQQRLQEIRSALRYALSAALGAAGLDAREFEYTDTGDGCRLVAPTGLPKAGLLVPLLPELGARIREHNGRAGPQTRMRVRVAVHAGEVRIDPDGSVSGTPFEALARLLDSDPLRQAALAGPDGTPVAAILSQHVYEETVGHGYEGLDTGAFTAAEVRVKEYAARAWLWYPGSPVGPPGGTSPDGESGPASGTGERPAPAPARTAEQLVRATGNGTVFAVGRGEQHIRYIERS
ncbi:hypothetical protein C7C46_01765 [Streptomyces tateyamensis]|uniref:Uncharacterized protein n=1 Tax=Streptomyces tateyamensis TaxID=565073 RepID=A0A2V4NVW2_9ACTN|nr:hypothetical protein [Streptomyces tateyamensis]PYC88024.1 hypothetical protein C7C46_01765 [Streptomyces tateyamensis]